MAKREMPGLADTGRRYIENTTRARLAGSGLERYERPRGTGARIALAVALAAALVAAMVWLSRTP